MRSPDVSWVENAKWDSLSKQQQRKFAPIDPNFVIELMSHPPVFGIPPPHRRAVSFSIEGMQSRIKYLITRLMAER